MPSQVYYIVPAPDAVVIDSAIRLWEALDSPPAANFVVQVMDDGPPLTGPIASMRENQAVAKLVDSGLAVTKSFTFSFPERDNLHVGIQRQNPNPPGVTDALTTSVQNGTPPERLAERVLATRTAFKSFDLTANIDRTLGPALSEFYRRREQGVMQLEELTQRLIEQGLRHRDDVDRQLADHRLRLDAEAAAERDRQLAESERRAAELNQRAAELEAREKELDAADNTHARRKLRQDLKQELKDRSAAFSLSAPTYRKRFPTHALFITWMIVSGSLLWHSAELGAATMGLIEFAASAVSLIGAIAFYIRWNDLWARQHADEEFHMRRLELDVDRASWAVEVALEWNEEKGATIPPELIDRLTENLFAGGSRSERARHPIEDLAQALLGASTALKIGVGGSELSIDRKGLRQFQKDAGAD